MNRIFFLLLVLLIPILHSFAQERDLNKIAGTIEKEAKTLYNSEWASWYGTDIFLEKCKDKQQAAGGFISYETPTGRNNVFYSRDESPRALITIAFGSDFNAANYTLDTTARALTPAERELYELKNAAQQCMVHDSTFKVFNNTNLNPVPIIQNGVKKVYVLTGPKVTGVVLFGNDYLINFDKDNKVTEVKKLHKSLIPSYYSKPGADSSKIQVSAMHSHLPEFDGFITVTDICTLMLYEKFTTWNQYMVVSKDFISLWDCKKNSLVILTTEAWKKIMDDQPERIKRE
ncbi:hypothetical protein [Mucilaginibacter celer]|uniref:Uncharacterized protein n=1 Tax=Mucilaginibacter celer TaxID=2305508 RepID=A0A494W4M9_9SPHI|nr:hypothetical protein [Mucilaginibacter celer]AYL98445.1 hypothetical protein HYN43_025575 [Mucilaginibacter celer]